MSKTDEQAWKRREPARIGRIISKLGVLWTHPSLTDMRLGQLLDNLHSTLASEGHKADTFMTEDDKWEWAIDKWLEGQR